MSKIKLKMVKFNKAIAVQILHMDERFRANDKESHISYNASNDFIIFSENSPTLLNRSFGLWGTLRGCENDLIIKYFTNNNERDIYYENVLFALEEWSKKCSKFEENFTNSEIKLNSEYEF